MEVQAQFPSNAGFSPDFRTSAQATTVLDGVQKLQSREQKIGHLLHSLWRPAAVTGDAMQRSTGLTNAKDFSDHPQNARTCNASSSSKRCRTDQPMEPPVFPQPSVPNSSVVQNSSVFECAVPSSSGRPAGISAVADLSSASGVSHEVLIHFYKQIQQMDAIFCIQNERLRLAMVESHKRYCSGLVFAHKQHMAKRLCEKEVELQNATRRNAELEKKLCEISADNLFLFKLAKNNEAIVASLRTSLEQVKVQNTAAAAASAVAKEGYGDSEGTPFPATDAQHVFERVEARMAHHVAVVESTRTDEKLRCAVECKVCRGNDACVLVLPCRHLCLCKACETAVGSCPVCYKPKDESLYVFLS